MGYEVGGLIGEVWHQHGGDRTFGPPISGEYSVTGGRDRRQDFEYGQIAWSPNQGDRMMIWAHTTNIGVYLVWGPTDPFHYDYFIVRWGIANTTPVDRNQQFDVLPDESRGIDRRHGWHMFSYPPQIGSDGRHAEWSFVVEGADRGTWGAEAKQGWTVPIDRRL